MRRIVLISGPVAVGKTSVAAVLVEAHSFGVIKSSQYLRYIAESQNIPVERTTLQNLGDSLDIETDYRWLIDKVAIPAMSSAPATKRWLMDAVRKPRQIEHFRNEFGSEVFHVHFIAEEQLLRSRYERRNTLQTPHDSTSYDIAVTHPNEVSARSLVDVADLRIDLGKVGAERAATMIVSAIC